MAIRLSRNPTKEGNKYYFDCYYETSGKKKRYRSKLYRTRAEAKKREREFLQRKEEEINITDYTFNEVIDSYFANRKKNWKTATLRANTDIYNHIRYKLGKIYVTELNRRQYEGFLSYLDSLYTVRKVNGKLVKKPYSARYKNTIVTSFKTICLYAEMQYDVKTKIPYLYVGWKEPKKKFMQIITPEQFESFVANVSGTEYQAFFTFLMYTGCRRGEALALTFQDVDFDNKTVSITKSFSRIDKKVISPKTLSSVRTIPLSAKALSSCEAMRKRHPDSLYVFGGKKPLRPTTIERKKNKALKLANLPYMRIHDFRHSFITMMVSNNRDIGALSHYVGHASIKQTFDTYTHYYDDKLRDMVDNL